MLPAERWIRAATLLSALLCALLPSPGFFSAPGQVPRLSTKAGFQLSRLGVGTWQWGNKLLWGYDEKDDSNLREVFRTFTAGGSNWFDTGDSYGTGELEGRAEILLGRFSREASDSGASVKLATKLAAYPWRLTPDSMVEAVKASNARLGRAVDIAQMHWSPRSYGFGFQEDALLEGLCRCYEAGLCSAVGLSNFGPKGLRRAAAIFDTRGVPLVLNQVQYSLLSAERESGVADVCKELGIRLVAYSPLCLGVLAGRYKTGPDAQLPDNFLRSLLFSSLLGDAGTTKLLGLLGEIADTRGKSMAQVALNFAMTEGGGCAIVGARNRQQALENLGACGWELSDAEVQSLSQAARKEKTTDACQEEVATWAGRAALRAATWAGAADEELLSDLSSKAAGQAAANFIVDEGRTPGVAPSAAGQAACKACEASGLWKASLKVQLSGRAAGAAAQQIGLPPEKVAVEAGRAAAIVATECRVRAELLAKMVGSAAGAAGLAAGMTLEQAAGAAKLAAQTEGYDAGLTPDVAARAGRLAYDKVLGIIHQSDSEEVCCKCREVSHALPIDCHKEYAMAASGGLFPGGRDSGSPRARPRPRKKALAENVQPAVDSIRGWQMLEVNATSQPASLPLPDTSSYMQKMQLSEASEACGPREIWKIFGDLGGPRQEPEDVNLPAQGMTYPKAQSKDTVIYLPRPAADRLRESNSKQVSELWQLRMALHRSMSRAHKHQCLQARLSAARAGAAASFTALENRTETIEAVSETNSKKLQRLKGVARDLNLKCKLASARLRVLRAMAKQIGSETFAKERSSLMALIFELHMEQVGSCAFHARISMRDAQEQAAPELLRHVQDNQSHTELAVLTVLIPGHRGGAAFRLQSEEQVLKAIDAESCSCPAFEDCEDDTSTGLDGPAPAPAEGNFVIYMYLPPLLRSSILPAPSKQAQQQLKKAQASGLLEGIVQEALSKFGMNVRVHRMRPPTLLDGGELRAPSGTAKIQDLGLVIAPSPPGRAWVVEAVEQNSWADAFGVRVADRILWINGWPTSAMSPAQLLQWSEHPLTLILD
ncbi:PLR1 [Symbiodinium sp. KB8]|nr:PLR1 [Symbiodinium sp. KB8]